MTQVATAQPQGSSPFDQIMQIDTDGTPIWRARQLMNLMGYPRWSDFQRVITRATAAAKNTAMDVEGSFRRSPDTSTSGQGARPRDDFKLTREAAYLTALNGDPNKTEVAGAQRYFVEQTRKQEAASAAVSASAALELPVGAVAVQAEETAAILRMLGTGVEVGLLDRSWAAGKAQLRVARVMGEEPELPAELAPLYVPDFLKAKGLTAKDVNSVQSWFGRRAVEIGEANGLDVPELRPTEQTNGSIRETRAWRREHLPLFEQVWDTFYAEKYARPMVLELGAA